MVSSRALFHLDDGDHRRVETVLRQVETLLADAGADHVDVEVVASGDGLSTLRKAPNRYGDAVTRLAAQGVRFVACAAAAGKLGFGPGVFLEPVELVPSGISELVWKRADGWVRMRP